MKCFVTGASGFVGRNLILKSKNRGIEVITKTNQERRIGDTEQLVAPELEPQAVWINLLNDCEYVAHFAARVHVVEERSANPLAEYRRVNTEATHNLARQAAGAGVKRFIYLSSIGVNGDSTTSGKLFTPNDVPSPHNSYSVSKLEAEIGLRKIAKKTGMEVVIIRPPLVYGANAPGNFGKLTRLVAKSLPLPLGSINNFRSFVGIDNLVDFIVTCLEHPAAANETFLVSDGEDLSTPDLIRRMARAMNRPARLLPVPVWALQAGASLLGKGDAVQRLCGNLQVDISKARSLLGWVPPVSVDEGLRRAVGGGW